MALGLAACVTTSADGVAISKQPHHAEGATAQTRRPTLTASSGPMREILPPQTTPPVSDECSEPLAYSADGNATPLLCPAGGVNRLAWNDYASNHLLVMQLGPNSSASQVYGAMCSDSAAGNTTNTIESAAEQLTSEYNGWSFGNESKFLDYLDENCPPSTNQPSPTQAADLPGLHQTQLGIEHVFNSSTSKPISWRSAPVDGGRTPRLLGLEGPCSFEIIGPRSNVRQADDFCVVAGASDAQTKNEALVFLALFKKFGNSNTEKWFAARVKTSETGSGQLLTTDAKRTDGSVQFEVQTSAPVGTIEVILTANRIKTSGHTSKRKTTTLKTPPNETATTSIASVDALINTLYYNENQAFEVSPTATTPVPLANHSSRRAQTTPAMRTSRSRKSPTSRH